MLIPALPPPQTKTKQKHFRPVIAAFEQLCQLGRNVTESHVVEYLAQMPHTNTVLTQMALLEICDRVSAGPAVAVVASVETAPAGDEPELRPACPLHSVGTGALLKALAEVPAPLFVEQATSLARQIEVPSLLDRASRVQGALLAAVQESRHPVCDQVSDLRSRFPAGWG